MKAATKTTLIAGALIVLSLGKSFASMTATKNPLTGELMYQETFKLNSAISEKQAFALVQQWFTASPAKFTNGNKEQHTIPTRYMGNKAKADETFKDESPIQSIDTASNWILGRSTIKYFGSELSSISVMYIEYYVVVEVHGNELTATISHLTYHHYNPFNYTLQEIYSLSGTLLKASGKFETLSAAISSDPDGKSLNEFVSNDMGKIISDLKLNLNGGYAMASK